MKKSHFPEWRDRNRKQFASLLCHFSEILSHEMAGPSEVRKQSLVPGEEGMPREGL